MQAGRPPQADARAAGAYQQAVDRWPVPVTALDMPTDYGVTHLPASGEDAAPVALLIPGGGATATAWSAVAGGLAGTHRAVAVDPIGQPGLSVPGQRPLATAADLDGWLDQVLDGLADWLAVATAGADLGRPSIVLPRLPGPAELAGLDVPVLVVVAGRSRAHDPVRVAERARELLPDVTVQTLAPAAHHTIPTEDADELAACVARFLVAGT
jgi:pimeloyl-ACP methyl ester carboxylesterase